MYKCTTWWFNWFDWVAYMYMYHQSRHIIHTYLSFSFWLNIQMVKFFIKFGECSYSILIWCSWHVHVLVWYYCAFMLLSHAFLTNWEAEEARGKGIETFKWLQMSDSAIQTNCSCIRQQLKFSLNFLIWKLWAFKIK